MRGGEVDSRPVGSRKEEFSADGAERQRKDEEYIH